MAATHFDSLETGVESVRLEAGRTIAVFSIAFDAAAGIIRREIRLWGLQINGFRRGAEPLGMLYRRHSRILNPALIGALIGSKHPRIEELLKTAFVRPQYRSLPWNGSGDFRIEVRLYRHPSAPNPNSLVSGAAGPGHDPSLLRPGVDGVQVPPLPIVDGGRAVSRQHAAGPGISLMHGEQMDQVISIAPELSSFMPTTRSRMNLRPQGRAAGATPVLERPEPPSPESILTTSSAKLANPQAVGITALEPVRNDQERAGLK